MAETAKILCPDATVVVPGHGPVSTEARKDMQLTRDYLVYLRKTLDKKGRSLRKVVKTGRTHMMDATPITFGQEVSAWVAQLDYAQRAIRATLPAVCELAQGGTAVGTGLNAPHGFAEAIAAELAALDRLFAALIRERISHGDFKGHNLFWDDGRWSLIDLDAMRQHARPSGFARAYARDRARFLRNWPAESALHRLLDARLPRL